MCSLFHIHIPVVINTLKNIPCRSAQPSKHKAKPEKCHRAFILTPNLFLDKSCDTIVFDKELKVSRLLSFYSLVVLITKSFYILCVSVGVCVSRAMWCNHRGLISVRAIVLVTRGTNHHTPTWDSDMITAPLQMLSLPVLWYIFRWLPQLTSCHLRESDESLSCMITSGEGAEMSWAPASPCPVVEGHGCLMCSELLCETSLFSCWDPAAAYWIIAQKSISAFYCSHSISWDEQALQLC